MPLHIACQCMYYIYSLPGSLTQVDKKKSEKQHTFKGYGNFVHMYILCTNRNFIYKLCTNGNFIYV